MMKIDWTRVRELIISGWTQEVYAKDIEAKEVHPLSEEATCFCLSGAIIRSISLQDYTDLNIAARELGFKDKVELVRWNDEFDRTKDEILDKIDRQILKTVA